MSRRHLILFAITAGALVRTPAVAADPPPPPVPVPVTTKSSAASTPAPPTTAPKATATTTAKAKAATAHKASKPATAKSEKPAESPKSASATPDSGMTLKADREGTVFKSLTIEGEDRIRIDFERPPIDVDLDPQKAPGLEWGSARDVLDRSVPDFGAPLLGLSAHQPSPYVARPWLEEFGSGPAARFKPEVQGVERWKLTVANARGEAVTSFQGTGDPPKEIAWDGRSTQGEPVTPGLTYSYVFEAFDRAGNKRNFVGEGFQLNAYRLSTPSGPVLVCAGAQLLSAPASSIAGSAAPSPSMPSPALAEVATWLNQSGEPTRPIRVAITARSADAGNSLAATIMRQLPPLVIGDPARVQCAVQVQPDAPESGAVRFSASAR